MSEFAIKSLKIPHRLILAPMCGITLRPFRRICKEAGAGLVFNQMVSAKALTMGDQKSQKMLAFDELERPFGLQLFGNDAVTLADAAEILDALKPDVIDLNLGCPAKKIVSDGGGSALLQDEAKLKEIFERMRASIKHALFTVKMRAGWDESSKNAVDVARMAEDAGVDAVALHARTRAQGYSGHADWSFIKHLKESVQIPVIGNGDVETAADAHRMLAETGCDAVMTGRAAFENPWIFREFTSDAAPPSAEERCEAVIKQYEYSRDDFGESGGVKLMRKHLCAYTKGFRGGSEFRNRIVRIDSHDEIVAAVRGFFAQAVHEDA